MSTRFDEDYEPGEWAELDEGRWEWNARRVLVSGRGQRMLRELEAALLALPERRLIAGAAAYQGEVCAIGALALHQKVRAGVSRDEALASLASYETEGETARLGKACGMAYTMAYEIAYLNDETLYDATPEGRYERVLAWVRNHLIAAPPATATERGDS